MDLTLLTCNYSTPQVTSNMVRSYVRHLPPNWDNPEIVIMDTSPESGNMPESSVYTIYDNPNLTHGEAVNMALDFIDTAHVLLVDSDIIFHKSIEMLYQSFLRLDCTLMGHVSEDRGGKSLYPRVDPWFCFINLKHLKEHNIKFFDKERTLNSRDSSCVYDIGSTMFEDVLKADLYVGNTPYPNNYYKHYEGMSWRVGKYNPNDVDTDIDFGGTHNNKALYDYGLMVEEQYRKDTEDLKVDVSKDLNTYFDKSFCINLDRRPDRWESFLERTANLKIVSERYSAFDGKKELTLPYPSSSELAGAISHRDVIQKAKNLNLKNVLIFEDDVEFCDDILSKWREIQHYIPDEWDMIYFGGNHVGGYSEANKYFYRIGRTYALHMYAVNNKFYDIIIDYMTSKIDKILSTGKIEPPSVAADYFVADLHKNNNCYVIRPHLAWQKEGYSDIQEGNMNYNFLK